MISSDQFKKLLFIFLSWRVVLFVISLVAPLILPYRPSFPYARELLPLYRLPQWLYSWANFDGVHYLTIAEKGYVGTGSIQAFFPLFPYVILHGLNLLFGKGLNLMVVGLVISNLAAFGFCVMWFALVKKIKNVQIAWRSLWLFLIFPTSFFMGAFYTEALFLVLVVTAFYLAEKKWWRWVALCVFFASAARIVGILLVPALLIELVHQEFDWRGTMKIVKSNRKKQLFSSLRIWWRAGWTFVTQHWGAMLWIIAGSFGTLLYMLYLARVFQDPFYFAHVQASFGGGRTTSTLIGYPQVIFRYLKILLTARPFDLRYLSYVQEFLAGTLALIVLFCSLKRVRLSHLFFALGAFLVPTLTGTFSSMPRYILVCLPIYIFLAEVLQKRRKIAIVYLTISVSWLVLNLVMFIQGYWVA